MGYKNPKEQIDKKTVETMTKILERGHIFVEGTYQNKSSPLIIWCPKHNNEHSTTFYNYNRSRTGCPCCGYEQVSQNLKNRKFSEETLEKMRIAANLRPERGGQPRRWRENSKYKNWRELVFQAYNNECAISGAKKTNSGNLVVHHLNSAHKTCTECRLRSSSCLCG